MAKIVLALLSLAYLSGCASGHCRGQENLTEAAKLKWQDKETLEQQKNLKVRVYKPDGSLQCGMGQRLTPEVMSEQLSGVRVFSMKNQDDGFIHIQACGTPTGKINVYEISMADLEKASKAGFKEWKK